MAKKKARSSRAATAMAATVENATVTRRYKRNFLKEVIVRIDFASTFPLPEDGPPRELLPVIKKRFPIREQKKQVLKQVVWSSSGLHENTTERFDWFYHGKTRTKTLHVAQDHLFVRNQKHESFDELEDDFTTVLRTMFELQPALQVKRLGLRYVDHIDLKESRPTEWRSYIIPALLAAFTLADNQSNISRAFHVLEFNYGDMCMRFQYGMPNPDYPATIRKKLFVLDYDAYRQGDISHEDVPRYLQMFHDKIKRSFEEVITDGLRDKMGVINAR